MAKVAILTSHPSHVWMFRPLAEQLRPDVDVLWVIRDKDVSTKLADAMGLDYVVLSRARTGLVGNGSEMLANIGRCYRLTRRHKVDLWLTKYGAGNIAATLAGRQSLAYNDDDADIVPLIAATSYRFARYVLTPAVTRMGKYDRKTLRYPGCHELFYLHPSRFTPDSSIRQRLGLQPDERYGVVRLSALQAHHDVGIQGVSVEALRRIIQFTSGRLRLFITSEKPLAAEFEHLRMPVPPEQVHHLLAFAEFLVGDSQTMTVEAAVLGTPAFRISDFVGRISYIDDVERYGLSFGFKPADAPKAVDALEAYLANPRGRDEIQERRVKFLRDKIDPVPWFAQIIRRVLAGESDAAIRAYAAQASS